MGAVFHAERATRVPTDFKNLQERMRQRAYPETAPVLAYFWLRTLYLSGYDRSEWNQLDELLREALNRGVVRAYSAILADIRFRIREDGLLSRDAPPPDAPALGERTSPGSDALGPYFVRLLNEWLSKEIAQVMIEENDDQGIPALAAGRALERLLVRQQLSPAGLDIALDASSFSPRFVYPEHYEILRDVVLFLLGRTAPVPAAIGQACLLSTAPDAKSFDDYADAVAHATVSGTRDAEYLEVPVTPAHSKVLLHGPGFGVASIVVTLDGRWWQAHTFRGGEQNAVLYRAGGRLRIDFSGQQVTLRVPSLERHISLSGAGALPAVELFGREWRTIEWDQDPDCAWLVLASTAMLPVAKLAPGAEKGLRRCRPAFVDMTWTALEGALSSALEQRNCTPVEQLRRDEVIPLGRSLFALADTLAVRGRTTEAVEGRLVAAAFHVSALEPVYGKVPWRVLPKRSRDALLGRGLYPLLEDRLRAVFVEVPEIKRLSRFWNSLPHSPKRIA
jgi:hypothetical protein